MKKVMGLIICVCAMFLTGCFALPAEEAPPPLPVFNIPEPVVWRTQPVGRGDVVVEITLTAVYTPAREEAVRFTEAGYEIEGVFISVGDNVVAGQLIASLYMPELFEELESARREHARLMVEVNQLATRLEQSLEIAERTETPVDDTAYTIQRERLADRLELLTIEIRYLYARYQARHAFAPFTGVVLSVTSFAEDQLSSVITSIATIADTTVSVFRSVHVEADNIPLGVAYEMTVMQYGREYVVTVEAIDPVEWGIFTHQAAIPQVFFAVSGDYDIQFTSTSRASVRHVFDEARDVITVPSANVRVVDGRSFVYVLVNDVRRLRYFEPGLVAPFYTQVLSGIEEGELIIT